MDRENDQSKAATTAKESLASLLKMMAEQTEYYRTQRTDSLKTWSKEKLLAMSQSGDKWEFLYAMNLAAYQLHTGDMASLCSGMEALGSTVSWFFASALDKEAASKLTSATSELVTIFQSALSDLRATKSDFDRKLAEASRGLEWAEKFGKHLPKTSRD